MELSIATDFNSSTADPYKSLKLISEAGFTHLHWCHHWNTDFLYGKYEIDQIRVWLKELGLKLLDIHASRGVEKCFFAAEEYRRKAGIELVLNRAHMLHELEGKGALMIHIPHGRQGGGFGFGGARECNEDYALACSQLRRSIDEMAPELEKLNIKLAVENMVNDDFTFIADLMKEYPAYLLGITYDSGHGNINAGTGLDLLEPLKDRITALHLNDNDGTGDQHMPPFYGSVNWDRMAKILSGSSYSGPMSFELSIRNTPFCNKEITGPQPQENCRKFLADAFERCSRFTKLVK